MKISMRKLWEEIRAKQEAFEAEGNYGEAFEPLADLIQYLDEKIEYDEEVLLDLIKEAGISIKEVAE